MNHKSVAKSPNEIKGSNNWNIFIVIINDKASLAPYIFLLILTKK